VARISAGRVGLVNNSGMGRWNAATLMIQQNQGSGTVNRAKIPRLPYPLHFQRIYTSNRLILKNKKMIIKQYQGFVNKNSGTAYVTVIDLTKALFLNPCTHTQPFRT
jgi:hypothetical protein